LASFSPLGKLAGTAIYFACVLSFLMIAWRTIITGSAGPIFAIFSPNENVMGADNQSSFSNISRDVAMASNFVKKWQTPLFRRSGI